MPSMDRVTGFPDSCPGPLTAWASLVILEKHKALQVMKKTLNILSSVEGDMLQFFY